MFALSNCSDIAKNNIDGDIPSEIGLLRALKDMYDTFQTFVYSVYNLCHQRVVTWPTTKLVVKFQLK